MDIGYLRLSETLPHEEISVHFENMLKDKRFSYRLKRKMKTIL
jgi:hypothetical protein